MILIFLFLITLFGIFVLAGSVTTSEKYNVSFEFSKNSIIEKCLDIEIQNLQDSSDELSLKTILNETNFDINQANNIQFYQWTSEPVLKYTYETVCNPYDVIEVNGTYQVDNCTQIISGNYTEEVWFWNNRNMFKTNEGETKLTNSLEEVKLKKSNNKFRLCFDTPIIETNSGWGNAGTIYLDLNGELFVDKTHSSWWDSSWEKKKEITGELSPYDYIALNVSANESMQSDFSDLRFTDASETIELPYWIAYKSDSNFAQLRIKSNKNSSIYMYYNSSTATSQSNITAVYGDTLVSYYSFEDDGSPLKDDVGSNDLSTSGTPTRQEGIIGKGYYLDSWDYLTKVGASGLPTGSEARTMGGFFNVTATPTDYGGICGYSSSLGTRTNFYIAIWVTTHAWYFNGWADDGAIGGDVVFGQIESAYVSYGSGTTLVEGWISGISGNHTLGGTLGTSNTDFFIGKLGDANKFVSGVFDEISVYNSKLTSAEIVALENQAYLLNATFGAEIPFDIISPTTTQPVLNSTDGTNRSNQDLNCYATLTDDKQTTLTADWTWYKNDALFNNGSIQVQNGTLSIITTLDSVNITKGEQWICGITPFDGINYGNVSNSTAVTILNSAPTHNPPTLTTPNNKNISTQDLTCSPQNLYDADNDVVVNVYSWYKDFQSFLALNLPFEINADDYSGNGNHGTKYGATFTNGKYGKALEFDGVDDYVKTTKNFGTSFNSFSAEAWVNLRNIATQHRYILERDDTHFYISVTPERKIRFRHSDLTNGSTETEANATEFNEWTHIAVVYDSEKTYIYVNGELKKEQEDTGNISFSATEHLYIGSSKYAPSYPDRTWNGNIDEVKIYSHALTPQQIQVHYNLEYNKIVSQQTSGGDEWMCQVTPNDGEEDGETKNSSELDVLWGIEFDVTSGEDGGQITQLDNIVCNNSWSSGSISSPFEFGFEPGSYSCAFEKTGYYDKTITFITGDKTIPVKLSYHYHLTVEEHTWLEWLYNCWHDGACWDLLENINQTTTQTWQRLTGTNTNVITQEDVLSYTLNASSNITINYTIDIPYKSEVAVNELLPIRIYFWFTDIDRTQCYSQDKATDTNRAESPYCLPLVAEILGPNDGTVSFQVDLRPDLSDGTYNFTRSIEIDPVGVWTQYGREDIGQIEVLSSGDSSIDVSGENLINSPVGSSDTSSDSGSSFGSDKESSVTNVYNTYVTEESDEEDEEEVTNEENGKSWITGSVIGSLLGGKVYMIIIGIFIGMFILVVVSRIKGVRNRKVY